MTAEGWPASVEGWRAKLYKYTPEILTAIDSDRSAITLSIEDFKCGHRFPLPSVLEAAVNYAAHRGTTLIFIPPTT